MTAMRVMGAVVMVSILTGCTAVYSPRPMGAAPLVLQEDAWEGQWLFEDGALTIGAADPGKGLLKLAWIEDMTLKAMDVHLMECNGWLFASVKDEDEDEVEEGAAAGITATDMPERYLWARVKKEEHRITIWMPDVDKFKGLVEAKELPGSVDSDGDVMLGDLTPDQLMLITSEARGVLFEWEDPMVLTRLKN